MMMKRINNNNNNNNNKLMIKITSSIPIIVDSKMAVISFME